ncbi:hypothetical protein OG562_36525 [Streptomyces sp. NBC_01275]|uniref:hypothetical protein n=1 Tax=Streptomyces sp. NBC_01275 TaxID=2903807 RepID=UPI00224F58AF|nr:hypothetical protein [Streptomyces sp. NBC_01275]MCX4766383.1 hypothetical protein [Streptomyces sp. NBC_01275]
MRYSDTVRQAVDFLLGLTDEDAAARIRTRIGLPAPDGPEAARRRIDRVWNWPPVPASVVLWVLEQDDPDLNAVVWRFVGADIGLRRAMARGVPFGPGRTKPLRVPSALRGQEPEIPESYVRHGLVGALREAGSMPTARAAGSMVLTRDDWSAVSEADGERPLPGYTRWVLSVRPDCPPALRARFGSHPKFTHRVRQAGVLDGAAAYATAYGPAVRVLEVLSMGHAMFPARVRDAEHALRPLVRDHLGEREEAWAVLAQLIETFHGTTPELVTTAGAIA